MIGQGVLWMILSRLWYNRKLVAMTLLGFVVAVAVVCSIPTFTDGALSRVLATELGKEETAGKQAAAMEFDYFHKEGEPLSITPAQYDELHTYLTGAAARSFPIKPEPLIHVATLDVTSAEPADARMEPKTRWVKLGTVEDLAKYAKVIDGALPKPGPDASGVVEAVITEDTASALDLLVGHTLSVPVTRGDEFSKKVTVRISGIIASPQPGDPLFYVAGRIDTSLLVDYGTFRQNVLTVEKALPGAYVFYFGFQAEQLTLKNLGAVTSTMYEVESRSAQILPGTMLFGSPQDQLYSFQRKDLVLRLLLLALSAPLLALVGYYLTVTAGLTVDRQRAEIAVLRSRGASLWQILAIYCVEGLLFAVIALLLGPPLGLLIAKVMGAAAGFVQFVDRKPLPVSLSVRAYAYGAVAALVALAATLAPAIGAARESIVSYKQQQARSRRSPLWSRLFLDVLLVALSIYGWYTLNQQLVAQSKVAPKPGQAPDSLFDPLHFILPAILIAGLGLLLLRVLPLVLRGLERLTRRWANAPVHLALTQVSRAPGATTPVVLLLTLTTGLGLYSAAAARTLERGYSDRIAYQNGADVVLDEGWEYDDTAQLFFEPPWTFHRTAPGVESAAQVRLDTRVSAFAGGRSVGTGTLMSINPPDFARTAFYRSDLLPAHINAYANLLSKDEEAVLVSSKFLARTKLKPGDRLTLSMAGGREVSLVIYAAVPYWPGLPINSQDCFIANLDYIQDQFGLAPYQTWLKMKPGAELKPVLDQIVAQKIPVIQAHDARAEMTKERRDPQRTGLYGALTIGFMVSAGLTVLGFLVYAVLSLQGRMLQLGVLRAMGLSVRQLLWTLGLEQLYAVGVGMLAGTGTGLLAARLYLPLVQMGSGLADGLIPFMIVADPVDRLRLYAVLGTMLLIGVAALGWVIKRMQLHQAVKLGEDG